MKFVGGRLTPTETPLYPLMTLPASQAMLGPCAGGRWRAGVVPVAAAVMSSRPSLASAAAASSVSVIAAALSSGGGRAAPRNPLLAGSPLSARSRFEPDPKKGKSGVDRFRRRRSDPTRTPPSFRRWEVPPARDLSDRPPRLVGCQGLAVVCLMPPSSSSYRLDSARMCCAVWRTITAWSAARKACNLSALT